MEPTLLLTLRCFDDWPNLFEEDKGSCSNYHPEPTVTPTKGGLGMSLLYAADETRAIV